jgi:hypothetical protein
MSLVSLYQTPEYKHEHHLNFGFIIYIYIYIYIFEETCFIRKCCHSLEEKSMFINIIHDESWIFMLNCIKLKYTKESSRSWFHASSIIKLNKNQLDAHLF